MSMIVKEFDKNFPERPGADPEKVLVWHHSGRTGIDPLGPRPSGHNWWFDYREGKWTVTKSSDKWYVQN